MPLVALPEPTNCWPYQLDRFGDALVASPTFQTLVGTTDPTEVAGYIFGKRLTHSRGGRVWTREGLAELRRFAMIQTENYGKRLGQFGRYLPFGATYLFLSHLVPSEELIDNGDGPNPTDAHDRYWQNTSGKIVDEVISHFDLQGPTGLIDQVDLVVDSSTQVQGAAAQGVFLDHEYLFTWSEK